MGTQELQSLSWLCMSAAAIVGGLFGAYATGFVSPFLCFGILACFGLVVSICGCFMSPELELTGDVEAEQALAHEHDEGREQRPRSCCQELSHNYRVVREALKTREMYRTILFFVIWGMVVPNYIEFMYFFKLDVVGFSQFTYSMLLLLGAVALTLGIVAYSLWLKGAEMQTLMLAGLLMSLVSTLCDLIFVLRLNLKIGIPDIWFVAFSSTVTSSFIYAFIVLPPYVLIAKITPSHVEATVFAFASTVM